MRVDTCRLRLYNGPGTSLSKAVTAANSFDIGTFFNTLSIDAKLERILEYQEMNSPAQLEYNERCSNIKELCQQVVRRGSAASLLASSRYIRQALRQLTLQSHEKIISFVSSARDNRDNYVLAAYCYIYTLDSELMFEPAKLLSLRDVFLGMADQSACTLDFSKVLEIARSYEDFWHQVCVGLNEHLGEHMRRKGSKVMECTEELFQPVELSLLGHVFTLTHACQILPIIDMEPLCLASCVDAAKNLDQLSTLSSVREAPKYMIGDPTGSIFYEILIKCKHLVPYRSSFDQVTRPTPQKPSGVPFGHQPDDHPLSNNPPKEPSASSSTAAIESGLTEQEIIREAIKKAHASGHCDPSTIDPSRCFVDPLNKRVGLFNMIGMLTCWTDYQERSWRPQTYPI